MRAAASSAFGDSRARLLIVRRQLDAQERVALDDPARRAARPAVDRASNGKVVRDARTRQALTTESVDPGLPLPVVNLSRRPPSELGREHVSERSLVALQRRWGVPGALLAAPTPHGARVHTVKPLVGKLAEHRASRFGLIDSLLPLDGRRQPAQDLGALSERFGPHHPTLVLVPASTPVGRLATASSSIAGARRASDLVAHVHAGGLGLAIFGQSVS